MSGKPEEIKLRVNKETKARVVEEARRRGETESLVVREAIQEYFARRKPQKKEPQ